jgi:CBS domain-containing protein
MSLGQEGQMKVRDVMTSNVVSVSPEASVEQIAKLLLENRISAVFVIDESGRPLGIVSEGDLMHRAETGTERSRSWWLDFFRDSSALADEYAKTFGRRARDVMTPGVVHVNEDASLNEVATLLETRQIKRVSVLRDGRIVGVVSRANLIQALAAAKPGSDVDRDLDRSIRERLMAELSSRPWASRDARNVVVSGGVVHLWGLVVSEAERRATCVAAARIPGVRLVEDHLIVRPLVRMDA